MKKLLLIIPIIAMVIVGCKFIGAEPTPPAKFEETLFNVTTNWVDRVVLKTNRVIIEVPEIVKTTNIENQVVFQTNVVRVPTDQVILDTNKVVERVFTPKETTKENVNTVGGILNTFLPGVGTAFAGIAGGILTMWGRLRSSKKTGSVLAQNVESMREFIKTLPDGAKYDEAIVKYLQEHQRETGTAESIVQLLDQYVSNKQARESVTEIKNLITSIK